MKYMEYKGYHAKIVSDPETKSLYGKIEDINDYVDFVCKDMSDVEKAFHEAVDNYLAFCKEVGKEL